jgi:ABC-type Mn2+/Zn2+ transport system permease subunit
MQDNPTSYTSEEQLRYRAQKISKFIYSIFLYIIINILFFYLDYSDNQKIDWAFWILFSFGFALAFKGLGLYVRPKLEDKVYDMLKK